MKLINDVGLEPKLEYNYLDGTKSDQLIYVPNFQNFNPIAIDVTVVFPIQENLLSL